MDGLSAEDKAEVVAAMKEIAREGRSAARHLRGPIYEVRANGADVTYRVLFAAVGKHEHVLLALHAFEKKTQRTPPPAIALALRRLADWLKRGTAGTDDEG